MLVGSTKDRLLNKPRLNIPMPPPPHPYPDPVPPFEKRQNHKWCSCLAVWPSLPGTMRQGSVAGKGVIAELPVGPMGLPAGGQRSVLLPWQPSKLGTNLTSSSKFQLVAGSPLPVPSCWVTLLNFTSLRCFRNRERPKSDKTGLPNGNKETNYSNSGLFQEAQWH